MAKQAELSAYLSPNASIREGLAVTHEADDLDNITSRQMRENLLHVIQRATSSLYRVRAALARIESGEYGVCSSCDEPIDTRRLNAVLWAERCVPCQEKMDAASTEQDAPSFSSDTTEETSDAA